MRITNDIVTLDAEDLDGLSKFALKALEEQGRRVNPARPLTAEQYLGRAVNQAIQSARTAFARQTTEEDSDVRRIINGLAAADPAVRQAAQVHVDALKAALGADAVPSPKVKK